MSPHQRFKNMQQAALSGERYKTVLLFGAPGAGKGTQGKILGTIPGFFHTSCGDVFRRINPYTELGKVFYEYSSRGELVPDDVTVRMWAESIHALEFLGDYKPQYDLLILDGIPRTVEQAKLIEEYVDVLMVLHLVCEDRKAMIERLQRRALKQNRLDDADERVISKRWDVYEKETRPVLDFYHNERIFNINSIGSPAMILTEILEHVAPLQNDLFVQFEG